MNFARLERLLSEVDNIFNRMLAEYPEEICCKAGCDDCCHACFDLSLAEAEYIKAGLQTLSEQQLEQIIYKGFAPLACAAGFVPHSLRGG